MKKQHMIVDALLDADIQVSESEICALAALSNKHDANIYEIVDGNNYSLNIKYDDDSEQVLVACNSLEKYTEAVRNFYALFIKHGGNIVIDDVFLKEEEKQNRALNVSKALKKYVMNKNDFND